MRNKYFEGIVYGFIHFSLEVASFYFLFSRITIHPLCWVLALLFDAVAFLPQGIFGMITDRFPKFNVGVVGVLLILAAFPVKNDIIALFLLASGNAMIHTSGAQHTLRGTDGKIGPNSIFVGAGSFGVITGQLLGGIAAPGMIAIPLALLALSGVAMFLLHKKSSYTDQIATFDVSADKNTCFIVVCAFVGVMVRSYSAYAIPTEWNTTVFQTVTLFVCMGIGKILGGILCDRIGYRVVTYLSLLGGLPFLLAGNSNMVLSLIGIALFSMTMPVTVAVLVSEFPKQPGFAFGITTVGLFLGSVPAFFVRPTTLLAHQIVVVILMAVALPAVSVCIKKGR